jgi:hypothetical protein
MTVAGSEIAPHITANSKGLHRNGNSSSAIGMKKTSENGTSKKHRYGKFKRENSAQKRYE